MNTVKIDFVSDIACPWCAVGLAALEQAIARVNGEITVALHFQPFALNTDMPPGGEDIVDHLTRKYRITPEQVAQNHAHLHQRGAQAGFDFRLERRTRTYNTFDAHRLLHWAAQSSDPTAQHRLKKRLLTAYFTEGSDPSDHEVLLACARDVGLDPLRAAEVLAEDMYADEVRAQSQHYRSQGIHSVPSVILNDRYLVQGGQPAEIFEQALRQLAGAP